MSRPVATRTSPVQRGRWLPENIIGTATNPPPAGVPPLKENPPGANDLTVRERMEQQLAPTPPARPAYKVLDPLGFALENFDAIGAWRVLPGEVLQAQSMRPEFWAMARRSMA